MVFPSRLARLHGGRFCSQLGHAAANHSGVQSTSGASLACAIAPRWLKRMRVKNRDTKNQKRQQKSVPRRGPRSPSRGLTGA